MTPATYPPIEDYGLIGDCHSVALVSRLGSIDWCCMPRLDSPSCFGRLLDWRRGGHFAIAPREAAETRRAYLGANLVLETRFRTAGGECRLVDAFAMRPGGRESPRRQLLRLVEGIAGTVELAVDLQPRLEYAAAKPWIRDHGDGLFSVLGGSAGLVVDSDMPLALAEDRLGLRAAFAVHAGERRRVSLVWAPPHCLHPGAPQQLLIAEVDDRLAETLAWWEEWVASRLADVPPPGEAALRSAVVLKGLTYAPTGAIVAAATTSLPETIGGERNWDYRLSWIRDSSFALESLDELGFDKEAVGFFHFIERTTAGFADEVQPMYGVDGRQLLPELALPHLEGYAGSQPVRIGNAAAAQLQLDGLGELLDLAWRSVQRGFSPDPSYWRFLTGVVETVIERWREPDYGIWEVRGEPRHFVHSQVMCWAALDRGVRLAEGGLAAPVARWRAVRAEIRATVEAQGYDRERGVFVQAFESRAPDAALLLLPRVDFVAYDDPRMVRTVDWVDRELRTGALVRRYRTDDGLRGDEGCFVACSFWLVQCLAMQGRRAQAEELFAQASALANDLGLFAEEHDGRRQLGNFPQGLSHYAHIAAALALQRGRPPHEPTG